MNEPKSYLNMVQYYAKFLPNRATVLCISSSKHHGRQCQAAFQSFTSTCIMVDTTLVTDHKLSSLGPKKAVPTFAAARMQRWALFASYDY